MKWKIYYDKLKTYSNEDGPLQEVPTRGVQLIGIEHLEVGKVFIAQKDYYWWDFTRENWFGGDIFGLFDYLASEGVKKVLFGRTVPNTEFEEIKRFALGDSYLPIKSAKVSGELV